MGRLRHLPNIISSIRILLAFPIAVALAHHRPVTTLCLFSVAAASDGIDGFLARRYGWQSELGGLLDPVADKLMLATVFVTLAWLGSVPFWLTATIIGRDCIIVLGAAAYRLLLGPVLARPSKVSKLNTLCQVTFILLVIGAPLFSWPPAWATVLGATVFVTAVVSGLDYVLAYGRLAAEQGASRRRSARAGGRPPRGAPPGGSKPA